MGAWLKKYGESIYETRGGPYKPGTWGGATCKGNSVYLHITQTWSGNVLTLPPLAAKILKAEALTGGDVEWKQDEKGLHITIPEKFHVAPDTIIKLTLDKEAFSLKPIASEEMVFVSLNATATASSYIQSWKGFPGSVTLRDFEVNMPETKYFGEDSEPTSKPESNHQFKPTEEMLKKFPWLNTRRDHIWRYWMAKGDDKKPWIEIDLGKKKTFNKITLLEKFNRIQAFELQVMKDGKWVSFYNGKELGSFTLALPEPMTAQKVRLVISAWESDEPKEGPGIREFDFWYNSTK
jgi:alpha-L-fucosidase